LRVAELRVPGLADTPFRDHYRALILGSALRSAEAEAERLRAEGHGFRARRAERDVRMITAGAGEAVAPSGEEHAFGRGVRVGVVVGLIAASALLVGEVAVGAGAQIRLVTDLAVIAFTLLWFGVSVADLQPAKASTSRSAELPGRSPGDP
jgi:hypothetical protein